MVWYGINQSSCVDAVYAAVSNTIHTNRPGANHHIWHSRVTSELHSIVCHVLTFLRSASTSRKLSFLGRYCIALYLLYVFIQYQHGECRTPPPRASEAATARYAGMVLYGIALLPIYFIFTEFKVHTILTPINNRSKFLIYNYREQLLCGIVWYWLMVWYYRPSWP